MKEGKSVQRQEEELQRHRCWKEPLKSNFLSCSQVGQLSLWVTDWSERRLKSEVQFLTGSHCFISELRGRLWRNC